MIGTPGTRVFKGDLISPRRREEVQGLSKQTVIALAWIVGTCNAAHLQADPDSMHMEDNDRASSSGEGMIYIPTQLADHLHTYLGAIRS